MKQEQFKGEPNGQINQEIRDLRRELSQRRYQFLITIVGWILAIGSLSMIAYQSYLQRNSLNELRIQNGVIAEQNQAILEQNEIMRGGVRLAGDQFKDSRRQELLTLLYDAGASGRIRTEAFTEFVAYEKELGNELDLPEAFLKDLAINDLDLAGINLEGATLTGSSLQRVDLLGANLSDAQLDSCWLSTTNLESANLSSADLRGTRIYANLRGANLNKANLKGLYLWDCDIEGSTFEGAELTEVNFPPTLKDISFRDATIRNVYLPCRMAKVVFDRADLRNVAFVCGDEWTQLEECSFKGSNLLDGQVPISAILDSVFDETTVLPDSTIAAPNRVEQLEALEGFWEWHDRKLRVSVGTEDGT